MPRPTTPAQEKMARALVREEPLRVRIEDFAGSMVDRSEWVQRARIQWDVDSFALQADVDLHREMAGESLAPLRSAGPGVKGGRRITIEAAFLEMGEAPSESDWILMFDGRIDDPRWGGRQNTLSLECRSWRARLLHDRWIRFPGTYEGFLPDVIQQLMDDELGEDAPTLVTWPTKEPPFVPEYEQRRQSLQEAIQALSDATGWVVRERWDPDAEDFRLVLYEPDRDREEPDAVFDARDFFEIGDISEDTKGVRTEVIIEWRDDLFGIAEDTEAIDEPGIGRRTMVIDASDDPMIRSEAEAQTFAELVLSDVSTALTGQATPHGLYWPVELGDMWRYEADDTWADEPRTMAVQSVEHVWESDPETPSTTNVQLRGRPSGGASRWHVRDQRTRDRKDVVPPDDPPPVEVVGEAQLHYTQSGASEGWAEQSTREESLGGFVSTTRTGDHVGAIFPALTHFEADDGGEWYTAVALVNTHEEATWRGLRLFVPDSGEDEGIDYGVALDDQGIVDLESESAQAQTIDSHTDTPTGLTFSAPESPEEGIVIGDLPPRSAIVIWVTLWVAAGTTPHVAAGQMGITPCLPSESGEDMPVLGSAIMQPLDTNVGVEPVDLPDAGIWEDWCGFEENWQIWAVAQGEIRALCASFGGELRYEPDGPWDGEGDYPQMQFRGERAINIEDRRVFVRVDPVESDPDDFFGFLAYFRKDWQDDPWGRFEWVKDNGERRLHLFILDGDTDEFLEIEPYDPHGAHQWFGIRHDAETDELHLEMAPDCGEWTTYLSGQMHTTGHQNLIFEFYSRAGEHTAVGGSGGEIFPGSLGPIYVSGPLSEQGEPEDGDSDGDNGGEE